MNRRALVFLALFAPLLSTGCLSGFASKPAVVTGKATGELSTQSRAGVRHEGRVVLAEVLKVEGESYQVKLTSGRTKVVPRSEILPIAAPGSLKAGDRVLAPQQGGGELWMADIVRIEGSTVVVLFNNASDEEKVPADRVAHLPPGLCEPGIGCTGSGPQQTDTGGGKGVEAPPPQDPLVAFRQRLKIGDKVLARWAEFGNTHHFDWRIGTVAGRQGDALKVKVPEEEEPKVLFGDEIRPLRKPKRPLASGMQILLENKPNHYVLAWIASGPDGEGKFSVALKRGAPDDGFVSMTPEELSHSAPFTPEDL